CNKYRVDPDTGKKNFAIVQAEDELAAIGMVLGATWNGARAFTATSGPGVSLMSEFLGLSYFAEIPAVLIDVQRSGPSTGMPTRTQQSDVLAAAFASHGDTKHILLFPANPTECFDFTVIAFDLAERFQTAVIMLTDLDLGMNDHLCKPFAWDEEKKYDRGKVLSAKDLDEMSFGRYLDVDGDGIPYRTIPGTHPTKGSFFTRGSSRDEYAKYTEDGDVYARNMDRLVKKWNTAKTQVPAPEITIHNPNAKIGIIYFGTSSYAAQETVDLLKEKNILVNEMRMLSFPFSDEVKQFIDQHEQIFVIEQNRDAQFRSLLMIELDINPNKLMKVLQYNGMPITAAFIYQSMMSQIK
ncbi:MAG: 2-oxoacid:acceptor oxidoreductase subunit alpha, partial [Saprospiraceae bacterium]